MSQDQNSRRRSQNNRKSSKKIQGKRGKSNRSGMALWKKILLGIVGVGVVVGVALSIVAYSWISDSPTLTEEDLYGTIASSIYDNEGNIVYETSQNDRIIVDESDISQTTFDAVTSIEDRRFMEHNGFDPIRIAGSFLANLKAGGITQGGSTLTQQLVKLTSFSTKEEDQTYKRKVQEIWLAIQLEQDYTKQEIFEFYINKVYMANGVYGMGTAAEVYYGKSLSELSIAQTALLAGMPQAPNAYDPYSDPDAAEERRNLVLAEMLENEKITQEEYDEAVATPIEDGLQDIDTESTEQSETAIMLDSYIQVVADEVEEAGYDMYSDGLQIYTHLDMDAMTEIYNTIEDEDGYYFTNDNMQAAASLVDTKTGNILALYGGRNQEGQLSYNRATQLERSVGSSIKPFADYATAIEYLNYSTESSIKDEEYTYSDGTEINNWDNLYQGTITLRQALIGSRNIPALKLLQEVGTEQVDEFLQGMGIVLNDGDGVLESNAIGGEITPLQLSAAFATLGNYGEYNQPRAVDYFTTFDGEEVTIDSTSTQAMEDSTAYMVTDMLKDNFTDTSYGLSTNYHAPGLAEAGKSGTTNYTKEEAAKLGVDSSAVPDTWMSGYTTDYALSIWTGYDNPFSTDEVGYIDGSDRHIVSYLYQAIMGYLSTTSENADWVQPDSVHEVKLVKDAIPDEFPTNATPSSQILTGLANDDLYSDYQAWLASGNAIVQSSSSSSSRASSSSSSSISSSISSSSSSSSSSAAESSEESISSESESSESSVSESSEAEIPSSEVESSSVSSPTTEPSASSSSRPADTGDDGDVEDEEADEAA
ncbi:Penicillin-binding protein 1A [Aerococcus viridans]|uniref:Penicillin-binding protein n=2 Tax=Aerococcus viridans TaxID=1377 RepID=A0AAU8UL68_9LACT|nr:transglycosylase domain-containing protein [Aerococcus viridans]AMC00846.1 penicillin-binding protein [Aerococcus viridans]EFG49647.1 penicillin-binding protein, 1A family [Aerococcus viridans ATCC 11563 = CCUG 4311]SUU05481.1 Penicillin-binding protein 1A [Aerococcus viridans]